MDEHRLLEFTRNCIVTASEIAYVANEHKTLGFLKNVDEVIRYISKKTRMVTLFNELEIMEKYVYIQNVKYSNRFCVSFKNHDIYKNVFISNFVIIRFFEEILISALDNYEGELHFEIEFETLCERVCKIVLVTTEETLTYINSF